jgi:acyl carrier protein
LSNEVKRRIFAMTYDEIKDKVRRIFATVLEVQPEEIPETVDLPSTLFIDSLLVLEIIVTIEQEFDFSIDDDDNVLEILDSLDSIAQYIDIQLQKKVHAS